VATRDTEWALICSGSINHNPGDSASESRRAGCARENRQTRSRVRGLKPKQVNVRLPVARWGTLGIVRGAGLP